MNIEKKENGLVQKVDALRAKGLSVDQAISQLGEGSSSVYYYWKTGAGRRKPKPAVKVLTYNGATKTKPRKVSSPALFTAAQVASLLQAVRNG